MATELNKSLALTAAAGMVAGLVACGGSTPSPGDPSDAVPDADPPSNGGEHVDDANADKDCCRGNNACKKQGNCQTESNDCRKKNECRGQGGCQPEHCKGS